MVRRSALLKQSSSDQPPPYDQSPHIVAETTTTRTEVVTTTTTTHFFSFPLWKKRSPASSSSSRQNTLDVRSGAVEHGMVSSDVRSSFYMVEKDLPPTPSDESASSTDPRTPYTAGHLPRDNPQSLFSKPLTSAHAHASLEVGVSHVLPHVSPPSSPSEINTVAFAHSTPSSSQPILRNSTSAQRLDAKLASHPVEISNPGLDKERRRSRAISFNGPTLINVNTKSDVKTERNSVDRPSTPKGLARRASFWSRKKPQPEDSSTVLSPAQRLHMPQSPQLPVLHSVSPFDMSITITPSLPDPIQSKQKSSHSRGLSRSHSARSPLRPPPLEIENTSMLQKHPPTSTSTLSPSRAYVSSVSPSTEVVHHEVKDETNVPQRRLRAQTNPPLLNRLSLGWLPTSPAIPTLPRPSSRSIVPSRPHTSSSFIGSSMGRHNLLTPSTEFASSRSSQISFEKETPVAIPLPTGDEGPIDYLKRLQAAVTKAEVAGILASSSDPFYNQALRNYIGEFNFVDDPLDVAVRKLLMDVGLPRETQQIDRVIEAFANRYLQCNPALFTSDDHPYILAFSLIMLHTDAFNKSNKRKMSKADYIKNTRLSGIFSEVLDCFYDNIVFVPFIFIEDPLDFNGQRDITHKESNQSINVSSTVAPVTPIIRTTKIDPYYLITNGLLGPLRLDVDNLVPRDNPYSYEGTAGPWDEVQLQHSFVAAHQIEVSMPDASRASPFFSRGAASGIATSPGKGGLASPTTRTTSTSETRTLKLSKVGSLNRKDDVLEGGRKAGNRKWKSWTVILTGSQLLFFRDASWASSLPSLTPGGNMLPQSALLRPDELLSVRGAIAVYDKSYHKYSNTFRFLLPDGRQLLLQAPSENELNEWIAGINYASAFKTAGVRIRPLEMSNVDVKLTGVAAATSHLYDLQTLSNKGRVCTNHTVPSNDADLVVQRSLAKRKLTILTSGPDDVDPEVPTAPEVDGAEQLKATFDQVKADLAAGLLTTSPKNVPSLDPTSVDYSPSAHAQTSPLPSRTSIIQSKIDSLEARIAAVQSQLDTYMRFLRNISILTPFQKSTRERLTVAVQNIAQRITQARLEAVRLTCHRDILANDIASEGRSWHRAKTIALQAAAETLQNRRETIPLMTLSQPACDPIDTHLSPENSFSSRPLSSSPSRMSESSLCESFYSAMDFGPDWPTSEDTSLNFLGTFDSPLSATPSVHSHSACDNGEPSLQTSYLPKLKTGPLRTSGDFLSQEDFCTSPEGLPEEAQNWNQTRCAQRVSLVRVPSTIQLKSRSLQNSKA